MSKLILNVFVNFYLFPTSKANKFLLIVTILLIMVTIGLALYMLKEQNKKADIYSAVYLESGNMYFGKLHTFPKTYLTNFYFLKKNNDSQTNVAIPYILSKFTDSMWGPEDYLALNKSKIIWMGKLKSDSAVVKAINNPSAYAVMPTTTTVPIIPWTTLEKYMLLSRTEFNLVKLNFIKLTEFQLRRDFGKTISSK